MFEREKKFHEGSKIFSFKQFEQNRNEMERRYWKKIKLIDNVRDIFVEKLYSIE